MLSLTYAGEAGNLDKALATLTTFAENSSSSIDISFEKAEILRAASENPNYSDRQEDITTQALENYNQAVNNSKSPNTVAKSAIATHEIYTEQGNTVPGIALLEQAYINNSHDITIENKRKMLHTVGKHYEDEGNNQTALDWYERRSVSDWGFELAKGRIHEKMGNWYDAADCHENSIKLNRQNIYSRFRLIKGYANHGEAYKAKQTYKKLRRHLNTRTKIFRENQMRSAHFKNLKRLVESL